jgi:hypothetical protein
LSSSTRILRPAGRFVSNGEKQKGEGRKVFFFEKKNQKTFDYIEFNGA